MAREVASPSTYTVQQSPMGNVLCDKYEKYRKRKQVINIIKYQLYVVDQNR